MIIDFHTHAYVPQVAEKVVENMSFGDVSACTEGTIDGLLKEMDRCGVDRAVLANIATKPSQQRTINDWAAQIQNDRIIPFGTVHPDAANALDELDYIKSLGFKGVKMHPAFQRFMIDDPKAYPIYQKISDLGLVLLLHAGFDPVDLDVIWAPPKHSAKVIRDFPELKLVLAHGGGCAQWDDVEKYLVGSDVYFDLAILDGNIDDGQLFRIIQNHGPDRILFGSDCPWHSPEQELAMLDRLELHHYEKEQILHGNAESLLGIEYRVFNV